MRSVCALGRDIIGFHVEFRQNLAHTVIINGLLLEWVGAPLLPFCRVRVVATFEGLGVHVLRVFDIGAAVGADVSKLTIFTHFDLIFGDVPVFLKIRMV